MSYINRNILNTIDMYKNIIISNSNNLFSMIYNYPQYNTTEHLVAIHKLFYIIVENVRIDLNYLVVLDPAYDAMGFPALQRNLRSTIEAFYDLYNLSLNPDYLAILKMNSNSIKEHQVIPKKYKDLKTDKIGFYTLKDKANIAVNLNGYDSQNFITYKNIATVANSYVHNDIFIIPPADKAMALATMLRVDCCIICESYNCVKNYLNQNFNFQCQYDPCYDFNQLIQTLSIMGPIIF